MKTKLIVITALLLQMMVFSVSASDYVYVEAYGAVGDDALGDTAAINAAVIAAGGTSIVRFERGQTYLVDATVVPQVFDSQTSGGIMLISGSHIDLNGATIKVIKNALPKHAAFLITGKATGVVIENGFVVGDKEDHTYGTNPAYPTDEMGYGVQILSCKNITIRNIEFSDFTGDGVFTAKGADGISPEAVTIVGCTFDGCRRQGISITQGSNIKITGNTFKNIGGTAPGAGVDIESGVSEKPENILISNNVFTNTAGYSINQYDGVGAIISGNSCDKGISYGYGKNTTVVGNIITLTPQPTGHQFGITGLPSADGIVIAANVISGASVGIYIQGNNIEVSSNLISGSRDHGIATDMYAATVSVSGNSISQSMLNGITINTPNAVSVSRNNIDNTKNIGISSTASTDDVVIKGNTLSGFKKGIYAAGADILILENVLNQGDYLGADKAIQSVCAKALIFGNILQNIKGNYGIYVTSADIINNTIRDFSGYMEIYESATGSTILGNIVL